MIEKEYARINLIVYPSLMGKIRDFALVTNRSINSAIIRILEGKEKNKLCEFVYARSDGDRRLKKHINLQVTQTMKKELQKKASESGRSLNNYICTELMIFFEELSIQESDYGKRL